MKKQALLIFCGSLSFFILMFLGCWQISRKIQKESFIDSVKKSLHGEPREENSLKNLGKYSKIKINGSFLPGSDLHLYGRRGRDVYYLLTPFRLSGGENIMVARGWFDASLKKFLPNFSYGKEIEIAGLVLEGEKENFYTPKNDHKKNIWITLNIEEISKFLGIELSPYYLIEIDPSLEPPLHHIKSENLIKIKNDHLEYAITWFSLGIALLIILCYKIQSEKG